MELLGVLPDQKKEVKISEEGVQDFTQQYRTENEEPYIYLWA